LTLGKRLSPTPAPPTIAITWAELLPGSAPDFSDRASLERFADWLTLAELLLDYDAKLLDDLGLPGRSRQFCAGFVSALERDVRRVHARDTDQVVRALTRMRRIIPPLAERADNVRYWLEGREYGYPSPTPPEPSASDPEWLRQTGHLDVRRVLEDL
jgi:hypothetical protein